MKWWLVRCGDQRVAVWAQRQTEAVTWAIRAFGIGRPVSVQPASPEQRKSADYEVKDLTIS